MSENNEKETNSHEELEVSDTPKENKENEKEALFEKVQNDLLYLKAEFDNYRKRMIKDQDMAIKSANRSFVSELLTIVDFFDRALKHADPLKKDAKPEVANFVSGIEMTRHELNQMLSRFGVELLGQVGEVFDPNKHEAISQMDTTDENVDKVVEVFEKGGSLNGKILKPARVVVGKKAG